MDEDYRGKPTGSHEPPSKSELLASAKLIAKAAKSAKAHDADDVDKAKVAGAAADLLAAANQYGHLDDKSFGKYLSKAEDYLHHYHSDNANAAGPVKHSHDHSGSGGEAGGGGGAGDYIKMAQGLLKKKDNHEEDGHGHSSGGAGAGAGDYFKMAQGLFK